MKKIAIFTSEATEDVRRLIEFFNSEGQIRLTWIFTTRDDADLKTELSPTTGIVKFDETILNHDAEQIARSLKDSETDMIVRYGFSYQLPEIIAQAVGNHVISISSVEEAKEAVSEPEKDEEDIQVEMTPPEVPPTPDEEWAEALKINFDPSKIVQTPPPVPGSIPPPLSEENIGVERVSDSVRRDYYNERPRYEGEMPSTYLIWSILVTIFCCFIPGIIAIIFSSQVSTRYFAGDEEGARRASRNAEIWIIVSFVVGVIASTLWLPFMIIAS